MNSPLPLQEIILHQMAHRYFLIRSLTGRCGFIDLSYRLLAAFDCQFDLAELDHLIH